MLTKILSATGIAVAALLILGGTIAAASTGLLKSSSRSTSANELGPCSAYSKASKDFTDFSGRALTHSKAFRRLAAKAAANGESVQSFCAGVLARTKRDDPGSGPSATANEFGLCTAYSAVSKDFTDFTNPALSNSRAFQRLASEAAANGESVQAFCASVVSPTTTTVSSTTTTSTTTTTVAS